MSSLKDSRKLTVDWSREIQLSSRIVAVSRKKTDLPVTYCPGYLRRDESFRIFPTGGTYEGQYNSVGFDGIGTYTFPHGAVYEGYFRNGHFHGDGSITYPKGQRIDGLWENGRLKCCTFGFADGLMYTKNWKYVKMPDRSFQSEITGDLKPAGLEQLTNRQPTKPLKPGCFDTVEGYFDTKTNCVYNDKNKIVRFASKAEQTFIKENYRRYEDVPTGYRPDLYEHWTWGSNKDLEKMHDEWSNLDTDIAMKSKRSFVDQILLVSTKDKL